LLQDSDLAKWVCREHTRVKHELLGKYLRAWVPILGKWNARIAYFDGFAGRGKYPDGSLGSPIIAIRVADALADHYNQIRFTFVEKDADNFANLTAVLDSERASLKHCGKMSFQTKNDEFGNVAGALLDLIEKWGASLIPSFFFIDPFGFSGVPFDIVRRILTFDKTEVFFTFMLREVNRFLEHPPLAGSMTSLFGSDCWRSVIGHPDRERAIVELYRQQLHDQANAKFSLHFKVCESDSTATLYHLVHASNSFKGHSVMKNIMFNQGVQGTFAFLGRDDLAERTQTRLFDLHDTSALRTELLARFAGQTLTFDAIMETMCYPWNSEPPFIEKHYREVIKALEKDGSVSIRRISSKRSGLKGNDLVTFEAPHS
jgi:three-Cys-motif partner protein